MSSAVCWKNYSSPLFSDVELQESSEKKQLSEQAPREKAKLEHAESLINSFQRDLRKAHKKAEAISA
jgi:hypothetical protein